jgi:stage V sporulation protein R
MDLVSQHTKAIMEGCKARARDAGLRFGDETLEYIATNRDLLELSAKNMIPTLYDYWVHDLEVLRGKSLYDLYPNNPYETVINTRPAVSFYNDNNPDWLNVMIFYHVLAHIDFFQNNVFFQHTWHEDFAGQALADKRTIAMLRSEHGRWVDYVIEFARGLDNLVGYYDTLGGTDAPPTALDSAKLNYYFDVFLQAVLAVPIHEYLGEVDRYNAAVAGYGASAESVFLAEVVGKHPEFDALFGRFAARRRSVDGDLIQFLQEHSPFLREDANGWMKTVLEIVRSTSVYFQPQIRTKILNEGWASYWHDALFLSDDRIRGHEVDYARVNAGVTALPRVGLNPYALGMRLFSHLEQMADAGRLSYEYQRLADAHARGAFDRHTHAGREFVFGVRAQLNDFLFLNTYVDQDFVDRHGLFVAGKRLNNAKGVWEHFVQSRKAADYKVMLLEALYHPPHIRVVGSKTDGGQLYLDHEFEGKPLVAELIPNTMIGLEYLWGGPVTLETSEPDPGHPPAGSGAPAFRRVAYTMKQRTISKVVL